VWKITKPTDLVSGPLINASDRGKKRRRGWIWAERLVLICGIILLAIYCAARSERILSSQSALRKFDDLTLSAVPAEPSKGDLAASEVDLKLTDDRQVLADASSFTDKSGVPIAVLEIPKVHLEVPVFDGTNGLTLNHGVARIAGTARPGEGGNIGIAGHRDTFFRGLKDLSIGDAIELRTPTGIEMYAAAEINIVSPSQVNVLRRRSVPSLTLVTCYPFYYVGSAPQRYVVTASLIEEKNSEPGEHSTRFAVEISSPTRREK
jgi:sortase A